MVTVGAAFTVNSEAEEPVPKSGLVTVTLRAPVVAPPATATGTVSVVTFTKVVDPTVRPVPADRDDGTAQEAQAPVMVTVCDGTPPAPEEGVAVADRQDTRSR